MSKAVSIAKEQVSAVIEAAMKKAMAAGMLPEAELPAFTVERPADRSHGDFATNAAMASARAFRMAPPKIAAAIMENLDLNGTYFVKAETAGPGFMNFFLGSAFYSDVLTEVLTKDSAYGRSDYGNHRKVMVEFVSANPTGPMHMGNARGGALGDCLASVLDAAGYDVWREFYVNDAGNQLDKFGLSLSIRYQQLFAENPPELPEDSYHGEDILDLAKEYAKEHGDELMHVTEEERRKALVGFGLPKNIAKMKADMEKYRVHYDRWFLESDLHKDGEVMAVVDYLRDRGLTYEKDGAVWYKATEFGGEKDEVLVRANGNPTYFTADIAYHKNKFNRGFDLLIDIWGSVKRTPCSTSTSTSPCSRIPRTPCTTSSTPTRVFAASCAHWKPRASPRATAPQRSSHCSPRRRSLSSSSTSRLTPMRSSAPQRTTTRYASRAMLSSLQQSSTSSTMPAV